MAGIFEPCANVAARYRARPGNLIPAGKRLAAPVPGRTVRARATAAALVAPPVPVTITAPRTEVIV